MENPEAVAELTTQRYKQFQEADLKHTSQKKACQCGQDGEEEARGV
jgi:hypothetical protein